MSVAAARSIMKGVSPNTTRRKKFTVLQSTTSETTCQKSVRALQDPDRRNNGSSPKEKDVLTSRPVEQTRSAPLHRLDIAPLRHSSYALIDGRVGLGTLASLRHVPPEPRRRIMPAPGGRRKRRRLLAAPSCSSNDDGAHVGAWGRRRSLGHVWGGAVGSGCGGSGSSSRRSRRPLRAALADARAQAVHAVAGLPVAPVTRCLAVAPDLPPAARLARLGVLLHPGRSRSSSSLPGGRAPFSDHGPCRG